MRPTNLLAIACLVLTQIAGCSTQFTWVKPSDPKADYSEDLYDCTTLTNQSGTVFNQSDYTAAPAINAGPTPNSGCYDPNVSNVNCLSSTPQSFVPQTFNSEFGESSYNASVDRCMNSRGWKKTTK